MDIAKNSVGIDYHSKVIQIAMVGEPGDNYKYHRCENNIDEVVKFIQKHGGANVVALEASTGAAKFAEQLNKATGWHVKLCHPGYVNRMRNNPDKSDWSDSRLIADLTRVGYLPEVWLAGPELRDLKVIVRYRSSLVEEQRQNKLKIQSLLRQERISRPEDIKSLWTKAGKAWLLSITDFQEQSGWVFKRFINRVAELDVQIKEADLRLKDYAKSDLIITKLMNFRGVGLIAAVTLRAEIGFFSRFKTGKQLSRFCGYTPRNSSSGEKQADAGLIKAGNPALKGILAQVGHCLKRYDSHWQSFTKTLADKGKKNSVIVAAIVNRWLRRLFYQMVEFERGQQIALPA